MVSITEAISCNGLSLMRSRFSLSVVILLNIGFAENTRNLSISPSLPLRLLISCRKGSGYKNGNQTKDKQMTKSLQMTKIMKYRNK